MVHAILEGRKTQTRRIVKDEMLQKSTKDDDLEFLLLTVSQKYKEDDILWVRETFTEWPKGNFQFFASTAMGEELGKWKPSIHMPKEACRIFLKLKSIRVERLRNIFHSDARSEGVDFVERINGKLYYDYLTLEYGCNELFSFMTLWKKINGEESWALNPFVWVYEFEQIEKPLDFLS
jgi:hypothetical protein